MTTYNHLLALAFSLESNDCDGKDVTPAMLEAAVLRRIADIKGSGEWEGSYENLHDTYEMEE